MIRALAVAVPAVALVMAGAGAASAAEATVRIADRVEPSAVTVPAGGTVTWHNADSERHRVRSTTGPARFDSGNLEPSQTWSGTFSVPGVYRYVDARDDDEAYWGSVTVTGGAGTEEGSDAISVQDRSFSPAAVTVPAGTTVTWVNDSDRDHTVTAEDGSFDSGTLQPGARFTHTFDEDGSYAYFCALHGGMRGTVSVGDGPGGEPAQPPPDDEPGGDAAAGGGPDPVATASSPRAPPTVPLLAVLLLLAVALPASVLIGAWHIERALRRLVSPAAPRAARRPPART